MKTLLLGRYLLADGREGKCRITDVSLGGVAVVSAERGQVGERVVLYIDQMGRMQGWIVRHLPQGFAVALDVPAGTIDRIASRLNAAEARGTLNPDPERRREARIRVDAHGEAASNEPQMVVDGHGGRNDAAAYDVVDLSFTGADVRVTGHRPPVGAVIRVGSWRGRVVRHTAAGVAIEFVNGPATLTLTDRLAQLEPGRR